MTYFFQSPKSDQEWHDYYSLRWKMLRQPWQQPRGSEQDELEADAFHLMAQDVSGHIVGVGRLHRNSVSQAQVRYMAVLPEYQGKGIGRQLLMHLEQQARNWGSLEIILNARTTYLTFYLKQGYSVVGDADALFGSIAHKRMRKLLA